MSSRQPDLPKARLYGDDDRAHHHHHHQPPVAAPSLTATMLASATASMLARLPCHPLDTLKAKLQVGWSGGGLLALLAHTWRTEGVKGLYRGFGAAFVGSCPAGCVYFTTYELTKRTLTSLSPSDHDRSAESGSGPFWVHFSSGLLAEVVSCVLWVPIDVVKERLQVQSTLSRTPTYRGSLDAFRTILRAEGLRGLYRGYGATVLSFGPFSALYFVFYEQLRKMAQTHIVDPTDPGAPPQPLAFSIVLMCSATAGSLAALATNVVDMAKLRIQVERAGRGQGNNKFAYANVLQGIGKIISSEGWRGIFRGAGARIAFQAPTTAIALAAFEHLKVVFAHVI